MNVISNINNDMKRTGITLSNRDFTTSVRCNTEYVRRASRIFFFWINQIDGNKICVKVLFINNERSNFVLEINRSRYK